MKNLIYADLPAAYRLHYHFRFQTKNERHLFKPNQFDSILGGLQQICDQHDYHLLESKPEAHQLRCLLSLRPKQSPSKVMQVVKTNLSRQWGQSLSDFEASASPVWQRGFYVRTAARIDRRAVERYVETQDAHHGYSNRLLRPVAKHRATSAEHGRFHSLHAWAELHYHLVLVTDHRQSRFDHRSGQRLIDYFGKVAERKHYLIWRMSTLPDHVHAILRLPPRLAIGDVVENLMNNSHYFLTPRLDLRVSHRTVFEVWRPSYYVGTIGGPTTAQVKSFLRR